jgi:hypothetical protein
MPITTTPSSGPQGEFSTYTPIYAQTLSSSTSSITFSNIPTTFTDLVLVVSPVAATGTTFPWMRFNGLSTSIYSDTHLYGISSGAGSTRRSAQSRGYIAEQVQAETTQISNIIVHIMNYSNTTTNKTYIARNDNAASSGTYVGTEAIVGLAQLTDPITSITIGIAAGGTDYNLAAGSRFTLYGIKAAAPAPKATGGDVITTDGTYWYHAFKNSGLFDVKQSLTADYLIVAGGGGGGGGIAQNYAGSGGGAGGLRAFTSSSLSANTIYTVTVGAGGTGVTSLGAAATIGSNTTFNSTSVTGGGRGTNGGGGGGAGGSGGAAGAEGAAGTGNAGGYSPAEGRNGGVGFLGGANRVPGGGGGGAGGVGGNASDSVGGNGGAGTNTYNSINFSTWLYATATGVSGLIAGGGGGSSRAGGTAGAAGSGGGAAGVVAVDVNNSRPGINATSNTGGGGGGGGPATNGSTNEAGGSGGSGIVIVRYPV